MLPASIGPYQIVRKLGAGGMGTVYEAVHRDIERRVAIKVLRPEYAQNPEILARFLNEARIVNRIDHPGLCQVSDVGHMDNGDAYIVMEYLRGETLTRRLERNAGRMPFASAMTLLLQLGKALAAAHEKGIVHRDLKPDNVMIISDPAGLGAERAKLLDFGIAKLAETQSEGEFYTRSGLIMGTPRYMSPEQCRGAAFADDRSDVYALGIILFQLVVGRTPFVAESAGELMAMHMRDEPPAIAELVPWIPIALAQLVSQMLRKDPTARPDMTSVAKQLEQLSRHYRELPNAETQTLHKAPGAATELALAEPSSASSASTLGLSVGQTRPTRRKQRWRGIFSAAVVGLAILSIALIIHRFQIPAPVAPSVIAPPLAASTTATAAPSAKAPQSYTLSSQPSGAQVFAIDGSQKRLLGETPFAFARPQSKEPLTLRIRKAGFFDETRILQFDSSLTQHVILRQRPTPKTSISKRATSHEKIRITDLD